ncbi:MAG: PilN domain-containing protein [Patescibacteria group bacterium]
MFALEITDSELILANAKLGKIAKYSVNLPPGVFFNGEIQDFAGLKLALEKIHARIAPVSQKIGVIITTLSGRTSVTRVALTASRVDEKPNFQNLLSEDLSDKYYIVQELGDADKHKKEFLIAWTEQKLVEELKNAVAGAGFQAVDFELAPLSLARTIKTKKSEVHFALTNEGVILMKFIGGNFVGYRFHSLFSLQQEMGGRNIQKDILDELVEVKINHFNDAGFAVVKMNGSAAIGALEKFNKRLYKISFNAKTIKILTYSLIALFAVLGITEAILFSILSTTDHALQEIVSLPEVAEAKKIKNFIDLSKNASDSSYIAILDELYEIIDQRVTMERILIDKDRNVFVSGTAVSEASIINFRDKLLKSPVFQDVVLPLANLEKEDNGKMKFSLSATPK